MKSLISEAGLEEQLKVDSAGTSSYHIGEPADKRMRSAAKQRGIELTSLSRMVSQRDFHEFDLLIAMDSNNRRELLRIADSGSHNKVRMMSEYLGDQAADWPEDVPDPYYGEGDGFQYVLDMLQTACPNLLDELHEAISSKK